MKRVLALTLSSILLALLLTSCANYTGAPSSTNHDGNPSVSSVPDAPSPSPDTLNTSDTPEATDTIFTRDISSDEKEKALELLYQTVKETFAAWNTFSPEDWKDAYPTARKRVLETDSVFDFYMELKRFVALLNDHHSEVMFPDVFYDDIWITPIRFVYIDNGYYVVSGDPAELEKLPLFSKIVKIDSIPVDDYMEQTVFPYIWSAKTNTAVSSGGSYLARIGPKNTSQYFEALTPAGETVTVTVDRAPAKNWDSPRLNTDAVFEDVFLSDLLTIKHVDSDYVYVYIPSFSDSDVVAQFEAHLDLFKEAKGIILDVRGNTGGNSEYAEQIARHFINGEFSDLYAEQSVYDRQTDTYTLQEMMFSPKQGLGDITAPVVVLQDYLTFSAGEHFLDFMSFAENAVSIGTESAGATGDPQWVELPEGGVARISKYKIARHDKTPFLNIGIQPDMLVSNSIEDYTNGYDRILDAGLVELKHTLT